MRLQDKRVDFFCLILLDLNSYIGQLATSLQKSLLSFIAAFSLVDADLLRCLYETNDNLVNPDNLVNTDNLVNPVILRRLYESNVSSVKPNTVNLANPDVLRRLYETDVSSVGPKAIYLTNTDLLQQLAGC